MVGDGRGVEVGVGDGVGRGEGAGVGDGAGVGEDVQSAGGVIVNSIDRDASGSSSSM
jgi:hypothetical protein